MGGNSSSVELNDVRIPSLIRNGRFDVNKIDPFKLTGHTEGKTLLYNASYGDHLHLVKLLIEKGADLNKTADDGKTPLYGAASRGNLNIMNLLIEKGADVNIPAKDGATPLYISTENGYISTARFLIEHGANVDACNKQKNSPLHVASKLGRQDLALLLIQKGSNINAVNESQETPLHMAVNDDPQWNLVKTLLPSGADVEARDILGFSAWEKAELNGHSKIEKLILSWRRKQTEAGEAREINSDLLTYFNEDRTRKTTKFAIKFRLASDYISSIETTLNDSINETTLNLEQMRSKCTRKLDQKEAEAERLQNRIDEMKLSQEREELAREVERLEVAKTQLMAQIEEMRQEHREELLEERQKSKRELETQLNELLIKGERRIKKLTERIDELERTNLALLNKHSFLEGDCGRLSIEFEEVQNISQSSLYVDTQVSLKKVVTFKGSAGWHDGIEGLWEKLREVGECSRITINNIWSSGPVTGSIAGNVESLVTNN